ncbi:MAG: hypothetical protein QXN37_02100 [Candidatus Anstonellaceae archaeon]
MQSQKQNSSARQLPQQAKFFRKLLEKEECGESGRLMEGVPRNQVLYEKMAEIVKKNPLLGC